MPDDDIDLDTKNAISEQIEWFSGLKTATINQGQDDEREMSVTEIWSAMVRELNQILMSTEYPYDSITEKIDYGTPEWSDNRYKFEVAFEYQCCQQILSKMFGPSRNRESIIFKSNLGSNDEGVDSYILQKDPDFKYFGITLIQSKLHAPNNEEWVSESSDTVDKAANAARKVRENTPVGNEKFKEMLSLVSSLGTDTASEIPIYSIIVTSSSPDAGDYQTVSSEQNITTINYEKFLPLIDDITSTHQNIPDMEITSDLFPGPGEGVVNLAILSGKQVYEWVHSENGKRNDAILSYNVRMDLSHSKSKKKKDTAGLIRGKVDETLENRREDFLAFNNGLVICHIGKKATTNGSHKFQEAMLVNGGQTVQAILDYGWEVHKSNKQSNLDEIFIPVKFVSVENHHGLTVEVADAANSQNPIGIDDLLANYPDLINMQEWLRNRSEHAKIWLELKEGESESGLIDKSLYTYKTSFRDFDKETWIRCALAAAGVGYKQVKNKSLIWDSPSIQLAFKPGTLASAIPNSSRETTLGEPMWDNYNTANVDIAESVLMARTVHNIFDQIKNTFTTRTNKANIPDEELRTKVIQNAEIIKYFPYIGTSLFFHAIYRYAGDDKSKRASLISHLFNGRMFQTETIGGGDSKPSQAMLNSFYKKETLRQWLNIPGGSFQQWQPLVEECPYSDKAKNEKISSLIVWCWSILKSAVKVYSEDFNKDVRNCTEHKSGDYLEKVITIIGNEINSSELYPKKESIVEVVANVDEDIIAKPPYQEVEDAWFHRKPSMNQMAYENFERNFLDDNPALNDDSASSLMKEINEWRGQQEWHINQE